MLCFRFTDNQTCFSLLICQSDVRILVILACFDQLSFHLCLKLFYTVYISKYYITLPTKESNANIL